VDWDWPFFIPRTSRPGRWSFNLRAQMPPEIPRVQVWAVSVSAFDARNLEKVLAGAAQVNFQPEASLLGQWLQPGKWPKLQNTDETGESVDG
jgi:hypothetical protein